MVCDSDKISEMGREFEFLKIFIVVIKFEVCLLN